MQKFFLRLTYLLLFSFLFQEPAFSQNTTVKGRVSDKSNNPIVGASVTVKGLPSIGTVTTSTGSFEFSVPSTSDSITVSAIGFSDKSFALTGRTLNIRLSLQNTELNAVVVVGYGTQKKSSLTASIATVSGNDVANQPVGDLTSSLGGRAAGVLFTQGGGQAGNDAANILIRGIGTNGNSAPLTIVDGVPRPFGQLDPNDIASITILKDAAAVAPYGLGGANGVILVTTKSGQVGHPKFTYDGYVGWQNPTVQFHDMSSFQYATLQNMAAVAAGNPPAFTDGQLQKYKDGTDPNGYPNTDPFPDMLMKNTIVTSHNLSLSGGSDKVTYAANLGYFYQDGIIPNLNFQRYNLSANVGIQATRTTRVNINLNDRVEQRHFTGAGTNMQSIFENLINTSPNTPFVFTNGDHSSMYASFYDDQSYNLQVSPVTMNQVAIEQKLPLDGLKAKVTFSYDLYPTFIRSWSQPYSSYAIDTSQSPYVYNLVPPNTLPSFYEEYDQQQNFTYQGQLDYAHNFGKSAITGTVVLEAITQKLSNFNAARQNYQVMIPELFAGSSASTDISNGGVGSGSKQRSFVYRFTYAWNNKYFFEAAGRYDGHYYFAPDHRFGFFPAFSAGWRLDQEDFLKNVSWITELKLRGSWGESGNLAGGPFQFLTANTLYPDAVIMGGSALSGMYEGVPNPNGGAPIEGNPKITWETSKKTDVGFDGVFFNNQLSVTADYFYEKRSNMLIPPVTSVPLEYGISLPQTNLGIMSNHGVEITIDARRSVSKDVTVSLNANFSYARNKLIQIFENGATFNVPGRRMTGRPLGDQFGYEAIGFYTASDFDVNGNLKGGQPAPSWGGVAPGDIKYADVDHNGTIDPNDQVPIGYPVYPEIVYGFTPSLKYKNLELSLLFQGAANRSVQLSGSTVWLFQQGTSAPITALNYWTPTNTNATYPRVTSSIGQNNSEVSSFWQRNASYLRLRTMMLSYNLPVHWVSHAGMTGARIYVSGQNLITWTPLKNLDPEVATNSVDGNSGFGWYFPTTKNVTVGLTLGF